MEAFVSSYQLPYGGFRECLIESRALVAGSAALAMYLQQNGVDPGFEPGDMDIWAEHTTGLLGSSGQSRPSNMDRLSLFLIQQGYNLTTEFEPQEGEDYNNLHFIAHILSFMHPSEKKVQVILVRQPDILTYIHYYFDLSCCVTWWDPRDETLGTMYPEITKKKQMQIHPSQPIGEREMARIQKYEERGFSIAESPCAALHQQDIRHGVCYLCDTTAFDVFAYDDVNAEAWLRDSPYHILLQVGDQLQAYERNALSDYFGTRVSHLPSIGEVMETPHKQILSADFLSILPYSDYSIFRLDVAYSTNDKTLYTVQCFTVDQWLHDTPGFSLPPPEEEDLPDLIPDLPLYHPDVYWMD